MQSLKSRRVPRAAYPGLAAALLALVVYAISLGGTYIWDDMFIARDDPRLASPSQWKQLWTKDYFNGGIDNLYRPLTSTTFAVEKWLHGDRPWVFHLVNWLLHAAVAAAVAELARRCAGQRAAFFAGCLFAVHPIHVEVVSGIVGRSELLCTLAIFLALILMWRRPLTRSRAVAIFACEVVAVPSKEQGILLPLMLLVFGVLVWRRGERDEREITTIKWLIVAMAWATAAYLIGRESFLRFEWDRHFLDPLRQPMALSKGVDRILMPLVLLGHYAQLMVAPFRLSPDYGSHVIGSVARLRDPYLWLGIFAAIAWLGGTLWSLVKRRGFIAFCLIAAAMVYAITSNALFLIVMLLAERWMYLPSAFLLIVAGMALARMNRKWGNALVVALVLMGSVRTMTYAYQWNDPARLLRYASVRQPNSSMLAVLVAENLRINGRPADAEAYMLQRLPGFTDCWDVWNELALDAAEQHHWKTATRYADTGFQLNIGVAGTGALIDQMKADWLAKHPGDVGER